LNTTQQGTHLDHGHPGVRPRYLQQGLGPDLQATSAA
jgi:hypothetical protein